MAETVMKFGPEWLRALSDGGPNLQSSTPSVAPAPKYKLAEYRYGREEMLALFTEKTDPPAELKECKEIFSEKCQIPLALVPMSEDEHRLWARCINSDAVLRLAGKTNSGTALPLAERDRSGAERGGLPTRSRGAGVDRGRGRGRTSYYQRGSSYEDETENGSERRDFRSKAFERSTSGGDDVREKGFDRSIGRGELGEERLRKDTRSTDNWRSGNRNEERSWRNRGRLDESRPRTTSWRLDDNEENDFRNGPASRRTYSGHRGSAGDHWEDADEDDRRNSLPEWSLDDGPCAENKVGTFDSSGAFREESIDGDSRECEPKNWPEAEKSGLAGEEHDQSEEKPQRQNTSNGQATEEISTTRDPVVAEETPKNLTCDKVPPSSEPSSSAVVGEPTKPHQPYATAAGSHKTTKNATPTSESSNSAVNVLEEDGFAHLEKAAENMVAQWTLEEDQKERTSKEPSANRMTVLPLHHDDAYKWFYRDPQGELQGPFTPQEMLEWFTAGYFTMDLLVRRGCDEMFSHLGELIKQWNRVPFVPGQNPPPVRNPSSSSSSSSVASLIPNMPPSAMATTPNTLQIRQQQLMQHQQQQLQRQMYLNQELQMQTQLRQLLAQLKQREGFSELSPQQQQEVLVQHYVSSQQLQRRPLHPSIPSDQPVPNPLVQLVVPLVRGNSSPLLPQPVSSIWDLNGGVIPSPAFEEIQRQEQDRREVEEKQRKLLEEEQKRKAEEDEQRRRLEELQRKVEEERIKKEELLRRLEEERRQKEEDERIRMEEERQKMEEEKRRLEEQQRRQEEIKRLEELARKQREEEEKRRREAEEADRLKQQKKLQELERQRKIESEMRRQEQEDVFKRLQEQKKAWGSQSPSQPSSFQNTVSLAEIQRLQEQKDREERVKQAQLQQMQAIFQVQNMQQQQQVTAKTQLTWANSNRHQHAPVKTLAEIQKEEAERLAKHKQLEEQKQSQSTVTNAGIWSNAASQLSWKVNTANNSTSNSNAVWENCSISVSSRSAASGGFWDCTPASNGARKPGTPGKSNESALLQSNKTGMANASAKSNSRARKDEESVMKSFENQRRQASDEFTEWCIESLNKFRSYVDIPTFVAFLKDVEPPYEINDYVKSYLGENKEAREFAKQFIEKRSFYRNQAKKEATEEPMWGPAPAITPSANKSVVVASNASGGAAAAAGGGGESDGSGFVKAGKKRKKGKRVDSSILGFTVQADPDRMNAGEIEQIND